MKYNSIRRNTKALSVGSVKIGGTAPISIQSMTNTDTLNAEATLCQTMALAERGCQIVRYAVPTVEAAETIHYVKNHGVTVPIVADIHFDYKIALESLRAGVDKIRINPGNIGAEWKIREVADACNANGVPIRIGVNSGSLEKEILKKYGAPTPEALAESAFYHADLLEKFGFHNILISVKASNVRSMIHANRLIATQCEYPLHLGVTEAGDAYSGMVKSAAGIGALLCDGIGDTIRVSLTADPLEEIKAAKEILSAIGLYDGGGIDIVSCPTCGRTKIDLIGIAAAFKEKAAAIDTKGKRIKAAVMGCVVNGPGEAAEADIGIAGGDGQAVLFRKGEIICKIKEEDAVDALIGEIVKLIGTDTEI